MDITDNRRPEDDRAGLDLDQAADREMLLRAERLVAGTEKHEWAKVRVSRRIVTEERQITVPVRREELVVEYLDGSQPEDHPAGAPVGGERRPVEEFVLHEEVPRIEMDVVARERVSISVVTHTEHVVVDEQVSREQVQVEGDGIDPARLTH